MRTNSRTPIEMMIESGLGITIEVFAKYPKPNVLDF
jgi:hypothetical protein